MIDSSGVLPAAVSDRNCRGGLIAVCDGMHQLVDEIPYLRNNTLCGNAPVWKRLFDDRVNRPFVRGQIAEISRALAVGQHVWAKRAGFTRASNFAIDEEQRLIASVVQAREDQRSRKLPPAIFRAPADLLFLLKEISRADGWIEMDESELSVKFVGTGFCLHI